MKKRDYLENIIYLLILITSFVFILSIVSGEGSDTTSTSEWLMFRRTLGHTAWDGINFSIRSGMNSIAFNQTITQVFDLSSPTVINGFIYMGGGNSGIVYQLNASNVSQQIANFSKGGLIRSSVAVANDYVYATGIGLQKTIVQLNASNVSQQIANFTHLGANTRSSPAVWNGYVYFGDTSDIFYQLNASNVSQQIANFSAFIGIVSDIQSSPAVWNGYVYFGSDNRRLFQLNASNVSQYIANFTATNSFSASPAVANGYVYIGSQNNIFYQLNASNVSQQIANFTTGGQIVYSSSAVWNGYVYIGSRDNRTYQLNASNVSQQIANFSTAGGIDSSPAIAYGYLYVGSRDNRTYQLNASNVSQQIANFSTKGMVLSSPAVANGYVYFGSDDNRFYQLNASNISLPNIACEIWSCTDWGTCSGSVQTRTCTDTNLCGTVTIKPSESQSCTIEEEQTPGSPVPTTEAVPTITSAIIGPNTLTEITITNPNVDVTQIALSTTEEVQDETVSVQPVGLPPGYEFSSSKNQGGEVYQAFSIEFNKTTNNLISNASIKFKVDKEWIEKREKSKDNIRLFRKNPKSEKLEILSTSFEKVDNSSYYFSAKTPGFSTFVIFLGEYECTPNTRRCFEKTVQFCVGDSTWLVTEKCNKCVDGECRPTLFTPVIIYTWIIAFSLILFLITSYVVVKKGKNKEKGKL